MAGVDFSRPLLGAGASAKTDYAAAQARTGLNFIGSARFKRGVKAEIGLGAFADASAGLSKFIHASIEGTAFAEARAGIQLQLPLNLFDEFGFSARAEAIAQAAAGLQADLGLSIGDFVLLAKRDPDLVGLPLELLLLFLEEVIIGGAFEINVSASAKAHASVTVTGSIIDRGGEKAGFFYTIDAGAGLAAGVGMGLKAGAEFRDFRRFYGRAVDKTVDTTIRQILDIIPSDLKIASGQDLNPLLDVFSAVAKTALRIAYDVGLKISENNPGNSPGDMATLCNEVIKTFLEEAQRFTFNKLLDNGIGLIKKTLDQQLSNNHIGQPAWNGAIQERSDLAAHLLDMPDEAFQDSPEILDYWRRMVTKTMALIIKLGDPDPKLKEAISIIYCTSELLMEAIRSKINSATAYATAIGAGTINADTQPFKNPLTNQPPAEIKQTIAGSNRSLTYADLLQFLVNDAILDPVLTAIPELKQFYKVFANDFQKTEKEILQLFLQNAGSFDLTNPGGQSDPQALLTLVVNAIDSFITEKFRNDVLPQVLENVSDPNLRLYIEEVLFDAVVYVKDIGLKSLLVWNDPIRSFENDDFTEALAGVIVSLLGRTVIIVGDTFITATQEGAAKCCNDIADKIAAGHPDIASLHLPAELVKLVEDSVRIGGEVLGPLPDDTRRRVRRILYQVFEPLPPGGEVGFLENLADDFFIPNGEQMEQLNNELAGIAKDRFVLFVQKFILRVGQYILESLEQLIRDAIEFVLNWEKHLADALLELGEFLKDLEKTIHRLNNELIGLFQTATNALHDFLQSLGSSTVKETIRREIKNKFVDKGFDDLEDNPVYKNLPGNLKSSARSLVKDAVDGAMDSPLLQPVLNAISAISGQLDELLPDVRELNPNENLPEQLMELVLDKVEQNIRDHFGGTKPHISLTVDFRYQVWLPDDIFGNGHWETHHIYVELGRIEVNIGPFINIIRDAINNLDSYHNILNEACFKLANAFAKELELAAAYLQQEEKKKDQARLNKINEEHNDGQKEIAILCPTDFSNYTDGFNVNIHLGGVAMSCFGLNKDEAPSVMIFINGHLIPLKSLIVEESLTVKDNRSHSLDYDFTQLLSQNRKTGKINNAFNPDTGVIHNTKAMIITDSSKHFNSQQSNATRTSKGTSFALSKSPLKEQPLSKSVYLSPAKNAGNRPFLQKNTTIDKTGEVINTFTVHNIRPGQHMPASAIGGLLEERLPGISIQFKVDLDEPFITEGVNALTVVVIGKGGTRHQQSVSFTVSHEPKITKPSLGIISIIDKNTGKPKKQTLTVNSVLEEYAASAKKMSPETTDIFKEVVKNTSRKAGKTRKHELVETIIDADHTVFKKEFISVLDKKNKVVAKHEISYGSNQARESLLKEMMADSDGEEKGKYRIRTDKVLFEKVKMNEDKKARVSIASVVYHPHFGDEVENSRQYLKSQVDLNFIRSKQDLS